jgi:hypothetical protein
VAVLGYEGVADRRSSQALLLGARRRVRPISLPPHRRTEAREFLASFYGRSACVWNHREGFGSDID